MGMGDLSYSGRRASRSPSVRGNQVSNCFITWGSKPMSWRTKSRMTHAERKSINLRWLHDHPRAGLVRLVGNLSMLSGIPLSANWHYLSRTLTCYSCMYCFSSSSALLCSPFLVTLKADLLNMMLHHRRTRNPISQYKYLGTTIESLVTGSAEVISAVAILFKLLVAIYTLVPDQKGVRIAPNPC